MTKFGIERLRVPIEHNWSKVDWIPQPRQSFYSMLQKEFTVAADGLNLPRYLPFVGYSTMGSFSS